MRLEFDAPAPAPDEVEAIAQALQTVFRAGGPTLTPPSTWKLAMLYPDLSIDELRFVRLGPHDVF